MSIGGAYDPDPPTDPVVSFFTPQSFKSKALWLLNRHWLRKRRNGRTATYGAWVHAFLPNSTVGAGIGTHPLRALAARGSRTRVASLKHTSASFGSGLPSRDSARSRCALFISQLRDSEGLLSIRAHAGCFRMPRVVYLPHKSGTPSQILALSISLTIDFNTSLSLRAF